MSYLLSAFGNLFFVLHLKIKILEKLSSSMNPETITIIKAGTQLKWHEIAFLGPLQFQLLSEKLLFNL